MFSIFNIFSGTYENSNIIQNSHNVVLKNLVTSNIFYCWRSKTKFTLRNSKSYVHQHLPFQFTYQNV